MIRSDSFDVEVHERIIVDGSIGKLKTPLIHEDFKGLTAYIDRHNRYSTWEAKVRHNFLKNGHWGMRYYKTTSFRKFPGATAFSKSIGSSYAL